MSYIGNQPLSVAFLTDTFSGNGSTTAFTMTVAPANTSSILVAITGVVQDPSTYSVSGTTLTFSAAPPSGTSNISVRYLGIPASGVTTTAYRTVTETTATAGQTSFTIPSYTVGYVDVYRNGVRLAAADYTATTGTTVVLTAAATAGDTITTESFYVSSVLNAIPATAGSVGSTYIATGAVGNTQMAAGAARANFGAGAVLQVVTSNQTLSFSTSSGSYTSTGLAASITPSSSTSKIFVIVACPFDTQTGNLTQVATVYRGGTALNVISAQYTGAGGWLTTTQSLTILDSPATTSSTTYTLYARIAAGAGTTSSSSYANITLMEIAA